MKFLEKIIWLKNILLPVSSFLIIYLGCEEDPPTGSSVNLPFAFNTATGDSVIKATLKGTYTKPCGRGTIDQWKLYMGEFKPGSGPPRVAITIPCIGRNYGCSGISSRFGEKYVFIGKLAGEDYNRNIPGSGYSVTSQCRADPHPDVMATVLHHELAHMYLIMNGIYDHDEDQIHCIASAIPTICPGSNNDIQTILRCMFESELFPRSVFSTLIGTAGAWDYSFFVWVNPGCFNFPAISNNNWIRISSITEGGVDLSATVYVNLLCNNGPPRSGSISIAGNTIEVHQDGYWPWCP